MDIKKMRRSRNVKDRRKAEDSKEAPEWKAARLAAKPVKKDKKD